MGEPTRTRPAVNPSPVMGLRLQRQCACGQHTAGGGECAECRKKRNGLLQRSAAQPEAQSEAPPIVEETLRSPGQPLDGATRTAMESSFRHDFSGVRIHSGGTAAASARAVGARAYTVGSNVVFGENQYAPASVAGQRLLAHELAHVVQQRGAALQAKLEVGPVDSPEERSADAAAEAVIAGRPVPRPAAGSALLQREPDEEPVGEEGAAPVEDDAPDVEVEDGESRGSGETTETGELSDVQSGLAGELIALGPGGEAEPMAEGKGKNPPAAAKGKDTSKGKDTDQGKGKDKGKDKAPDKPKPWIERVDIDLARQKLQVTWSDKRSTREVDVSTGRGCPNTGKDPCPADTGNSYCTPTGDFHPGKKGDETYQSNDGSAMSWYVELSEVSSRGIGVHNAQPVTGSPRSHGCVRVDAGSAETINKNVSAKTVIHISGKAKTSAWELTDPKKLKGYKECPQTPPERPKPKAKPKDSGKGKKK